MANDPPATTFAAPSHRSLRDAGLVGEPVTVSFAGRALHLSGAASGSLRIEAGRCERARFGYLQGKYHRHFVARIWLLGEAKPLVIEPTTRECPAYGAAMRAFAEALAATRGLQSVERGLSGLVTALLLTLQMVTMLIIAGVGVFALGGDLWLGGLAMIGTSCLLSGIFLWLYFARQRPRPVVSVDELNVQLPGAHIGAGDREHD